MAVTAQGFDHEGDTGKADIRHLRRAIHRMGLLQLDFVNVLVPAHYLVLYSRLGSYRREALNRLVFERREFIEHWAHEASIVPMEDWPLLEYRRKSFKPWRHGPLAKMRSQAKYLSELLEIINKNGASRAQDMPQVRSAPRRPGDWHRSVARSALEYHFGVGNVSISHRLTNFQRIYDLTERIVREPALSQQVSDHDAHRALLRRAATAFGVATLDDLADYYRMPQRVAAPRIEELREEGFLREVCVEGWTQRAWRVKGMRLPRSTQRNTLLSPFDPLIWYRPRTERLFNFRYRIEIYVPEKKRQWGYYVLPVLIGDQLVARVDLKADRSARTLLVRAAYFEPGAQKSDTAVALAPELFALARWLDLDHVKVGRKGNLARSLRQACKFVFV